MNPQPIVIVGAGGFGREILDVIRAIDPAGSQWSFLGFVADIKPKSQVLKRIDANWIGTVSNFVSKPRSGHFVIGIGDPKTRRQLAKLFTDVGMRPATLIHPSSTIGADVEIGEGSVICSHVSVTTNVRIGSHVHLNLNSTVGHDTNIGHFVTINPLSAVSGDVKIEDGVSLGTNSAVIQGLTIETGATVGAGAVVVKKVDAHSTVVGVPAKPLG
jgi:sugar O-acyltransferase (sialic acid O-acetyltransferase NeuD family)